MPGVLQDYVLTEASVVDSDAHVIETEHTWEYLETTERRFRPQIVQSTSDRNVRYWLIDGKVAGLRTAATSDEAFAQTATNSTRMIDAAPASRKMDDVGLRLKHLDSLGIDVQVLHNSIWIEQLTDRRDVEVALCRSWNRWLADIWQQGGGRLLWTCVVPVHDRDAAIAELTFARDHGAVGVCIQPYMGNGMMLDEFYCPIYSAAEQLELAIIVHIANGNPALVEMLKTTRDGRDGFATFRVPTMLACYGLLKSELPSQFPRLRWGFVEASAQWIPWVLNELSSRTGESYSPASNPFRTSNVYVTTQNDEDQAYVISSVGDDNLVIGTDYGHADTSSQLDAISVFRHSDFDADLKRKILLDNPAKLYGLSVTMA